MRRFLLGLFCLVATSTYADCTGSGLTWSCAAGTTSAQISTTLGSASDGATLTFANGSYTWSSFVSLSNTKGATLVCQSVGGCDVTATGTVLGMNGNLSGTNTKTYRISGFDFTSSSGFVMWFYGAGTLSSLRIDNNTFAVSAGVVAIFLGENATVANFYGVIDHNTLTSTGNAALLNVIGALNSSPPAAQLGTANNMFVENNTITFTGNNDVSFGCLDGWGGAAVVWRYNTTTNCLVTLHGVLHGGGPNNIEVYNNSFIVNGNADAAIQDCYRCFHHQGSGTFVAFNNTYTAHSGKSSVALSMMHYRSGPVGTAGVTDPPGQCDGTHVSNYADGNRSTTATYRGYPCYRQPGRDVAGVAKPMFAWNNKWSDTSAKIDIAIESTGGSPNYTTTHLVANRDYFNAVSKDAQTSASAPFDGTAGTGFGTLARRPTTCTAGTEAADAGNVGVGYYATDQAARGRLYICSSTNTWTTYYEPYRYPHPLTGLKLAAPGNPTSSDP